MAKAWVDGAAVSIEAATAAAARILDRSRLPVIAGLGTDVAGTRAAIALAERLGAAYDHAHSAAVLRDLDVLRQAGCMLTTPNETRLRADVLLFVGPGLTAAWPSALDRLGARSAPRLSAAEGARRLIWIGPSRGEAPQGTLSIGSAVALPVLLGCLRATLAGRRRGLAGAVARKVTNIAAVLTSAKFGVAVWSAHALEGLAIEMLCGLVGDLNAHTRFSGLPLAAPMNGAGVLQVSGWMTGFPMRTGFGRGYPEHDTWRFDAVRMIESGEADAALWIDAAGDERPAWTRRVPLVAIARSPARFAYPPHVQIEVGAPGVDHAGVLHAQETGTLVAVDAAQRSEVPSVADVLGRIAGHLDAGLGAC